ncbi:MAG: anthranilate synthase component I family protein [Bacteroidales bacterium]|nr:anthranilate synthase component I family protein [Bacteroidales bacterium]
MRLIKKFLITDFDDYIKKLLNFLKNEQVFIILDSTSYSYKKFKFLAAWGIVNGLKATDKNFFDQLFQFHNETNDWLLGHISYDVKNIIEELDSKNIDNISFPDAFFFQPMILTIVNNFDVEYHYLDFSRLDVDELHYIISNCSLIDLKNQNSHVFKKRMTKQEYKDKIHKIKKHIQLGDIYELNFCQEFYTTNVSIDPFNAYYFIRQRQPMPFSAFYRYYDKYLMCASPERFLNKTGDTIISQPIKGTIRRGKNEIEDAAMYNKLKHSEKDRAENIMIVDLVRNDLAKTAVQSSVIVKELCEVYTFPSVFQMISTVQSTLSNNVTFTEAIKMAFPMGSMTGAPKIEAMKLIDDFETIKRGLYSGTVGYITPEADFDFNVVIRSLQYNENLQYASMITGGAITINSDAEQEYEECLIKAKGLLNAINSSIENG